MYVYKFRQVNDFSLNNLADGQLYFAHYESFNDPFECKYKLIRSTDEELKSYAINVALKNNDNDIDRATTQVNIITEKFDGALRYIEDHAGKAFNNSLDNHKNNIGILSLTHEQDAFKGLFFWSMYADGGRGFCLEFDYFELKDSINNLNNTKTAGDFVRYKENVIDIQMAKISHEYVNAKLVEIFTTKHTTFSHEKEFRMVSINGIGNFRYSKKALKKIIIGERMPKDERVKLIKLRDEHYPDTEILLAKIHTSDYKIELANLN
ncbi:DUF2971 domain-containing protein [Pseudoalteromonas sp. MTN2-4]|uniref:DUF2971 domain-containing protein n=1 Tax=Pseudoalteromonas sp. MTN2-4 TaxID=3056555 RepID=UPI0036F3C0D0